MGSYYSTPTIEEKCPIENMEGSLIVVENPNSVPAEIIQTEIPEPAEIIQTEIPVPAEIIQTEIPEPAEIIQTEIPVPAEIIQPPGNYIINGITYIYAFPIVWAQNHLSDTGPESCSLCILNGMVNDIFVGYCRLCASVYHDYERGLGFINNEYDEATVDVDYIGNSAFLTYLKDVELPYDYSDMPALIEL
jgi:hypothetical protein